jgi:F-type H+-transporting ATPase subunit epsilon
VLRLKIISPERIVLDQDVRSVTLPTQEGEITVLPKHAPLYTLVTAGEVIARGPAGDVSLGVGSGFANVTQESVTLLANFGVLTDEIDEARASAAKARAEDLVKNKKDSQEFAMASLELSRSLVELKLAGKRKR